MSDERLRQLERAAAAGDAEARAQLLLARWRAGQLPVERLRLAVYLGSEDAQRLLDALGDEAPETPELARGLGDGLYRWDVETCARAVVAAARCTDPVRGAAHAQRTDDAQESWYVPRMLGVGAEQWTRALEAAERWIACPCDDCAGAAGETLRAILGARVSNHLDPSRGPGPAPLLACRIAALGAKNYRKGLDAGLAAAQVVEIAGEEQVFAACQRELIPWALGLGDPVRLRVAERGQSEIPPDNLEG